MACFENDKNFSVAAMWNVLGWQKTNLDHAKDIQLEFISKVFKKQGKTNLCFWRVE